MKKLIYMAMLCLPAIAFSQDEFKPGGKINGTVFGDYYYMMAGDTALSGEYKDNVNGDNGFAIRRVYLGYDYNFSEKISAGILLESNDGTLDAGGKRSFAVKKAYAKWKNIYEGGTVIIGAQSTPTWSLFTEKEYGYRSVEKTIVDFRKHGSSNDVGILLTGYIPGMKQIGYNVMFGNGTGQKPENDKYKKLMVAVNAKLLEEKLRMEIYFDDEKKNDSSDISTIKGYVGVHLDKIVAGVEPYMRNQNTGDMTSTFFGVQTFVRGDIIPERLGYIVRADIFNPEETISTYNEMFVLVALDYKPIKNVSVMPNLWINSYSKIENAATDKPADIVGRLTFSVKF